jgi:hypothetical protein
MPQTRCNVTVNTPSPRYMGKRVRELYGFALQLQAFKATTGAD